jgi:phage replication-related protein YjqB (UPF0714/DUF867 family)
VGFPPPALIGHHDPHPMSEAPADRYRRFAELAAATVRGVDYDVVVRSASRDPTVVVAAPHSGGIEPGTTELARAIGGDEHALYVFEGLRPRGNEPLHLTSTRFDEPSALDLVGSAEAAVTVHGCRGGREQVYVGGLHADLGARVRTALADAGFPLAEPPRGLEGRLPANLTNRARQAGVQLELSWALRRRLFASGLADGERPPASVRPTAACRAFVSAVRESLAAWQVELDGGFVR